MLADTIGAVLSLAVGVALSPVPIIGVVLMLATPQGRGNGIAFVVGWIGGLAVVGGLVLLAAGGLDASDQGQPATWVSVLELVLGAGLVLLAVREWRSRPAAGVEPPLPTWMAAIDGFSAARSGALGFALAAVNPKNLLLTVAAAAAIAQAGMSTGNEVIALAVFALVGTLGPAIPVAIYLLGGSRSAAILADVKRWMTHHNAAIMAVLLLVIGAKLLGDGVADL